MLTGHGNKSGKPLTGDPASSDSEAGSSPCSPLQQDNECSLNGMGDLETSGGNTVRGASFVGGLLQQVDNVSAVTCSFCKLAVVGSSMVINVGLNSMLTLLVSVLVLTSAAPLSPSDQSKHNWLREASTVMHASTLVKTSQYTS